VAVQRTGGRRQPELGRALAVAGGGGLGTLARYGADRALPAGTMAFPWSTFLVNVIGSFILGALLTLIVERWSPTRFIRPFAAIGFCGGFTTFSTFAVEIVQRGEHDRLGLAVAYLAVSLVAGLAAAAAGITLVRGRVLAVGIGPDIPDPDDIGVLFDTERTREFDSLLSLSSGDDEDEDPVHT
jgi:fluoride exporter